MKKCCKCKILKPLSDFYRNKNSPKDGFNWQCKACSEAYRLYKKSLIKKITISERFWANVKKTDSCWLWGGSIDEKGYGKFYHNNSYTRVHRFSFELTKSKIPKDMCLDHLCRVRHCVNPNHLEIVTFKENHRRGKWVDLFIPISHCRRGHQFTKENTYIQFPTKKRGCKTCFRNRDKFYKRLKRLKTKLLSFRTRYESIINIGSYL